MKLHEIIDYQSQVDDLVYAAQKEIEERNPVDMTNDILHDTVIQTLRRITGTKRFPEEAYVKLIKWAREYYGLPVDVEGF